MGKRILVLFAVLVLPSIAFAATKPKPLSLCLNTKGLIVARAKCKKSEVKQTLASLTQVAAQNVQLSDVQTGPQGDPGPQGEKGAAGPTGATGA